MCTIVEINGDEFESIKELSSRLDPIVMEDGKKVSCNDIVDDECLCNCNLEKTAELHGLEFNWEDGEFGEYGCITNKKL